MHMQQHGGWGRLLVWGALCPLLLFPLVWPGATAVALTLFFLLLLITGWRPPPTPINPSILLYLCATGIAFVVSPLPWHSLPRLIIVTGGVVGFWLIHDWLEGANGLHRLLQSGVILGGVLALIGLFTVQWPSQYIVDVRPLLIHLPRTTNSSFLHPNELAGVLLLLLPLAAVALPTTTHRYGRYALLISTLLMGLMLLLTQSRNAWLALLVATAVYRFWGRIRFAYFALGGLALILIPFALGFAEEVHPVQSVINQIDDATKSGPADEPSWLIRLEIWSVAGQMAADYPVLGGGLYTFDPLSRLNYVYTIIPSHFQFTHAHNLYWQTAVSLGLVGLVALLAIWGAALHGLWAQKPPIALRPATAAVVGAACVAYLCFNLFDMVAWEQKPGLLIWALLAVALRLSPPDQPAAIRRRHLAVGFVTAVWFLLLLSPIGRQNWQRLQLDQARVQHTALTIEPTAFTADARRLGLAYWHNQQMQTAVTAWRHDPQAAQFLRQQGVLAYDAQEWETAVQWLTLSLQLDASAASYYWLGMVYEAQKQPILAQQQYELALAALPGGETPQTQAEIWEGYGRIMAQQQKWATAAHAFAQAVSLYPQNGDYAQQLQQINNLLPEIR